MRDIVYFLKGELPLDGAELRYSLRSLSNLPHGKVWFVTPTMPEWVQGVNHVPWEQKKLIYRDLSAKYKLLHSFDSEMTDDVYVMDDDIYITKPLDNVPIYKNAPLKNLRNARANNLSDQFGMAAWATYDLLVRLGWDESTFMHPCQHAPFPLTRSNIPVHLDDGDQLYEYKILYANHVIQQGEELADMMYQDPKGYDMDTVKRIMARDNGLLSSLEGRHLAVFSVLKKLFPEAGEYEVN